MARTSKAPRTSSAKDSGARTATVSRVKKAKPAPEASAKAAAKGKPPRDHRRLRQIGLLCAALGSVFACVSLATYDASDPSFFSSGGQTAVNAAGPVGAWVADGLHQVFGYGAWTIGVVAVISLLRLAGRKAGTLPTYIAWAMALQNLLCVLALLGPSAETTPFPAGGLLGLIVSDWIRASVGPAGTWIVLLGVALAVAPFVAPLDWERVASRGIAVMEREVPRFVRAVAGRIRGRASYLAASLRSGEDDEELELGALVDVLPVAAEGGGEDLPAEPEPVVRREPAPKPMNAVAIEIHPEPALGPLPRRNRAPAAPPVQAIPAPEPAWDRPRDTSTMLGQRLLVEAEFEPTCPDVTVADDVPDAFRDTIIDYPIEDAQPVDLRDPASLGPAPWERRKASPADERDTLVSDADDVFELPASAVAEPGLVASDDLMPLDEVEELEELAPEPVVVRPQRKVVSSPLAPEIEITPGNLVSGGNDDGGAAVYDVERWSQFELPNLGLLDSHARDVAQIDMIELQTLARTLEEKFESFKVEGEVTAVRPGPVITTFEYVPAPGIPLSRISKLNNDIAMAMKAETVRIVAPIPGRGAVGVEIPSQTRQTVWIRDIMASEQLRKRNWKLPLALGKSVEGKPVITDLTSMPHVLVGGTTGSGKSVGVNAMLLSMLFTRTPEELKLILIDPKFVEFQLYRDIPHLLHPVVVDPRLAAAALKWACDEMDRRLLTMSRWNVRDMGEYNEKVERELKDWSPAKALAYAPRGYTGQGLPPPPQKMPYLVVVIDELADLMMVAGKDVDFSIARLAQKARAAGIHLIVATQRPSADVVTGIIRSNMPCRIGFKVRASADSRIILDSTGAEALLGNGDMLFMAPGQSAVERVHGPYVASAEVERVTDFLRDQGEPDYSAEIRIEDEDGELGELSPEDYDDLYDAAVAFVVSAGKASTSMVQREFKIGYNRAARIIDIMEREGVVGPADGARPREVLVGRRTG